MTVGVCARVKDEQRIIRDWVRHYLRFGFDRVILYDDGSNPPVKETLADNTDDRVIVIDTPTANQGEAYRDGLARCKDLDWVLLCDADEFLWTDGRDIKSYLASAPEHVGTILVHWLTYGTSGIQKMHPHMSIFRQFTMREPYTSYLNGYVKSFVRPAMTDMHVWVHVTCSPHKAIIHANGTRILDRENLLKTEYQTPVGLDKMPMLLAHYMTLDHETMARKAIRNKALTDIGNKYTPSWYKQMFTDSVRDRRMVIYDM